MSAFKYLNIHIILFFTVSLLISCDQKQPPRIYDPNAFGAAKPGTSIITLDTPSDTEAKASPPNNIQDRDEKKPEDFEDDYTECDDYTEEENLRVYVVCRNRYGGGFFLPALRGDVWGVGTSMPEFFSLASQNYVGTPNLWRSSYSTIAPRYDQYGNALYYGCPGCQRVPYYNRYGQLAAYYDDGLYYYENGYWSNQRAYRYFSNANILKVAGFDKMLSGLISGYAQSSIGITVNYIYNILDVINQKRYGCPYAYNVNICYGNSYY